MQTRRRKMQLAPASTQRLRSEPSLPGHAIATVVAEKCVFEQACSMIRGSSIELNDVEIHPVARPHQPDQFNIEVGLRGSQWQGQEEFAECRNRDLGCVLVPEPDAL